MCVLHYDILLPTALALVWLEAEVEGEGRGLAAVAPWPVLCCTPKQNHLGRQVSCHE